jgi:hypothetical protein
MKNYFSLNNGKFSKYVLINPPQIMRIRIYYTIKKTFITQQQMIYIKNNKKKKIYGIASYQCLKEKVELVMEFNQIYDIYIYIHLFIISNVYKMLKRF